MANEMLWTTNSGFLTNNQLNKMLRYSAQPIQRFRQFVGLKEAFGKNQGQSVNWDKIANTSEYGGKLVETNTMHETKQVITQGTVTVDEYGLSIPFTRKIETLSEFSLREIVEEGLGDDQAKVIDGVVEREFNKTPLRYVGTATAGFVLTTNSVATATNTSVMNEYHIRKMALELKKRHVPGFGKAGGDYVMIASYEVVENLQGSMLSVNQYTTQGYEKIASGEVGRIHGVRVVEDGFATRFTFNADTRAATAISWGTSNSLVAYMFGAQTVREAVAVPEEVRVKTPTDFGRSQGIAWYGIFGWAIEWTDEPNARIIKWDSAG